MARKDLLLIIIFAILLVGCGGQLVPDVPTGEPPSGAPRKGSILTPEGGGGDIPTAETATETAPPGLIEMATLTAQADLASATGTAGAETKEQPATAEVKASATAGGKSEPTQASTKVGPTKVGATKAATTKETATKPAATKSNPTKTAKPTATKASANSTAIPVPSNTHAPSAQPSNTPVPTATFTAVPSATPAPSNTTAPQPSKTSAPAECSPGVNSAFENEVVSLINAERSKAGLSPLTKQSQLTAAARLHSQDMACNDFFSHTSPTTGSPFDRIAAQGYTYSFAGENIAAGYGSAAALVEGWMNSPGHRANILNENYTQIGVGYAYWSGSTYGSYSTAVFARP